MPDWHLKDRLNHVYLAEIVSMVDSDTDNLHKLGWQVEFDWSIYCQSNNDYNAYKLLSIHSSYIQGAIAYRDNDDHVYVDLLESAPQNRYRFKDRIFVNVTDVLLGQACLYSQSIGYDGFVSFVPKNELIRYYQQRFNAKFIGNSQGMYLDDIDARRIIELYYY
ncbi:hypothetical protein PO903_08320 [Paenibacillus sp. PK4536]|uniref:hypothetical protein n=1 Tax=unclassified Paenibacillus TaxID=185978 RepID=UPI0010C05CE2|nr:MULTISPECIES: hypothetical protein [unclassified Paenibacillus]TKJ88372.1 hypothetical protein PaeCFBP13512_17800 [Paenibacillus sp. CFBP13512]WIM40866.1 hypothetical protein PO903_08320 [Paenibacillus sp. PK4536]